jgi:hypothetical protein
MSFNFLVPAFLAGLLALAVPVIVHLTQKQTRDPVRFPSLMFLEKTPDKTNRRREITRWPLLLLRCAAIALLVLAFARPFIERSDGAILGGGTGDREVVVLLDRSYSMAYGDRWERAVAAGLDAVNGLQPGDRGTVIVFDESAEAVTESTTDLGVLRSAIQNAQTTPRTTRYGPALRYASRLLGSSPMPRHELIVISDFQHGSWERDVVETGSLRLPPGTEITPVSVRGGIEPGNVSVAGVDFERSTAAGRERVSITSRITGIGGWSDVPVTLEVDGRAIETRTASLGEEGSATVEFSPLTLPEAGAVRGIVRVPEDGLQIDNQFRFVLSSDQRLRVLILNGNGIGDRASYFVDRALAIGDAPGFRTEVRAIGSLRAADLAERPVVILNQTGLPSGEAGEWLKRHVQEGGGMVMVVGGNSLGDWLGVLPSIGQPVDRFTTGGTTLGYVDTGHPVFETFAGPRRGDFSAARVFRYRPIAAESFPRVLARYGDGGVALAERPVGEGRVLVFSSTLDGSWNDLALQPVFLPFLHQLVKYAAGYAPARSWLTVGEPFDAGALAGSRDGYSIALTPSGEQIRLEAGVPLEMRELGFYELRSARTDGTGLTLAVNYETSGADLGGFDPEEMRSALVAASSAASALAPGEGLTLAERERQQSGWWYLIIAAFLLLVAETLFSNGRWSIAGSGRLGNRVDPAAAGERRKTGLAG